MQARGVMRLRRVGPLLAAGALTVTGLVGCASGDGGRDGSNGKAVPRQAVGDQAAPKAGAGAAKKAPSYCKAVKKFDGLLRGVPTGNPEKVQASLDKVSTQMQSIAGVAPKDVAADWKKLRSGFDQLNKSYELLDGIGNDAMKQLRSSGSEEVTTSSLKPQQVKQYEKFRKRAESISSKVESSGKKVSKQTEKKCGITIGE